MEVPGYVYGVERHVWCWLNSLMCVSFLPVILLLWSPYLFWVYILYNFLAILISNGTLFLQRFAAGKCIAGKRQLQIIYGNMIETEDVIREY